jgi:putative thioredoxin
MQVTDIQDANQYQKDVIDASHKQPVVAVFWADWCGPCKLLKPKLEKLQAEHSFGYARVNVGESKGLAMDNRVRAVPTVVVYNRGTEVLRFAGDKSEGDLRVALMKVGAFQQSLGI